MASLEAILGGFVCDLLYPHSGADSRLAKGHAALLRGSEVFLVRRRVDYLNVFLIEKRVRWKEGKEPTTSSFPEPTHHSVNPDSNRDAVERTIATGVLAVGTEAA